MSDRVLIEGLAVDAVIGVYDWEREIQQRLELDLTLAWDNRTPGHSDRVDDALDYAAVTATVRDWFADNQPELLEAAGEALAALIRDRFGVQGVRLVIRKPGILPGVRNVGVVIERGSLA
ncbi:dihydroneopterin aldolase [Tamilnaduibacter salinus]|uniref:dihydroneopterin aldolase n=1 Tax=Tamilnaduibacter salinus TaxID=1484056 RepID=UPI000E3254CE|nr:dihydroneopterin aldolase [Tamilnaduibacter salinus]